MPNVNPTFNADSQEWSTGIRRFSRYAIDVRVKVMTTEETLCRIAYGRGTNISEGGIAAYISLDLNLDQRVTLELTLPYCVQTIKVSAMVRDRRGFCYGLEFENLSPPQKETVLRTCRALSLVQ